MDGCRRGQSDRLVPMRPARLPHDEGAGPAGRPHHQQRLGVGACAAAQLDTLRLDQARADRIDPLAVPGRTGVQHRLRPDRYRQRRDEDTARGRLQASGRVEAEARIDVRDVAKGVLYMAELPPEANVLFMTVMANKMPYVGRG